MTTQTFIQHDCVQIEVTNDVGEPCQHILDVEERNAINTALAINRPLLVWGEPGIGKSQLAKAIAKKLGRVFISFVTDAHTEPRDLLWSLDSVARLAEAQIQNPQKPNPEAVALENFISPGVLWWALNWDNAKEFSQQTGRIQMPSYETDQCDPENGVVVLIDEMDKANGSVPNGLLEALGSNRFHPQGLAEPVTASNGIRPLIMVTTNDERSLPDAFVRRCLALHLSFPETEEEQLGFLMRRAKANFADLDEESILRPAAKMMIDDRHHADTNNLYPLPGQAEYFDLLRGMQRLQSHYSHLSAADLMKTIQQYTYRKHVNSPREKVS